MNEFKLMCVYPEYAMPIQGRCKNKIVGYRPIWMKHGAYDDLKVKHKAFLNVHSNDCHESMISTTTQSWKRAGKRLEAHMPQFDFQTDEY